MEWQPIDSPPVGDEFVIVLYLDETGLLQVCKAAYDNGRWASYDTADYVAAIGWMPLPSPPSE